MDPCTCVHVNRVRGEKVGHWRGQIGNKPLIGCWDLWIPFSLVIVCVCVYECVICAPVYAWTSAEACSEATGGYRVLYLILLYFQKTKFVTPPEFRLVANPWQNSSSLLTPKPECSHSCFLPWELGIWTSVPMHVQQTLLCSTPST